MDSTEARALLRLRDDDGLHSPAYVAQGILLADIHEWMEDCVINERLQHAQHLGDLLAEEERGDT